MVLGGWAGEMALGDWAGDFTLGDWAGEALKVNSTWSFYIGWRFDFHNSGKVAHFQL